MSHGPLTRALLARWLVAGAGAGAVGMLLAAAMGPAGFAWADVAGMLAGDQVLRDARLPRVILGALCGGALALVGAALQAVTRNPLADPYVVGVSGGAALGGTLVVALARPLLEMLPEALTAWLVPLGAYAGALGAMMLGAMVPAGRHAGSAAPLLFGVVFNAFCLAAVGVVRLLLQADTAQALAAWLLGGISSERWSLVGATAAYVVLGGAWVVALGGRLHLLGQGVDAAERLGVDVIRTRRHVFLATSLLVGGVVSVTGMIGFVGLVVPHAARRLAGPDARVVLPLSALLGAALLPFVDGLARLAFPAWGTELPVGALTALLGAPVFLWLLVRGNSAADA